VSGRHRGEPKRPNPCPWPGCRKRKRSSYLMCRGHWFRLPAELRARILATYRPGQTAATASPEYLEALAEVFRFAIKAAAAERGGPVPLADRPAPCPDGCGHPLTVHSADLGCWLCDCVYGRGGER
jgi:hypothetical protein